MAPGEHADTFRGNNFALVSATAALDVYYWRSQIFSQRAQKMGDFVRRRIEAIDRGSSFAVQGRMTLGLQNYRNRTGRET